MGIYCTRLIEECDLCEGNDGLEAMLSPSGDSESVICEKCRPEFEIWRERKKLEIAGQQRLPLLGVL